MRHRANMSGPPGRFDRSSPFLKASCCVAIRSKQRWPGSKRVLVSIVRVAVFSPSSRSPSLIPPLIPCPVPLFPGQLLWSLPLWLRCAALHVCLHHARSEEGQLDRHRRRGPSVSAYSYKHGSPRTASSPLRETKPVSGQPTKVPLKANLRTRAR